MDRSCDEATYLAVLSRVPPEEARVGTLIRLQYLLGLRYEESAKIDARRALEEAREHRLIAVTEGTKGLIQGIGIGSLFGMGEDEPAAAPENVTSSSGDVSSDALTQSVQNNLKTLGYDPGNTNGETSMQTSIAISQFQAEKGLEVTGEVTPQLAGMLEAEVEKR